MFIMKKFLATAAALLLMLALAGCSGRNADFGYVDMQKLMQESTKVKQIQEKVEQKSKELTELTQKEEAEFAEATAGLSGEELTKKQQEQQEKQKIRQGEITALFRETEEEFRGLFDKAVSEVMQEKKLGAVLMKDSVLSGGVDVTEDILKKLN